MCSYNALNGVPTCADSYILQTILRDHWNWTGDGYYVTSDCDAIQNIYAPHYYAPTREQAVADALTAGTDLNCVSQTDNRPVKKGADVYKGNILSNSSSRRL